MHEPLTIGFPVIDAAPWCLSLRGPAPAILLECNPIPPLKTHCLVVGQLRDGRKLQFTIPMHVWREALRRPVQFVSVQPDAIGAATGVLYGPDGNPLPHISLKRGSNGSHTV